LEAAEEEEDGDIGEDEKKNKVKKGDNLDLVRETGAPLADPSQLTGGPSSYGYSNDFYSAPRATSGGYSSYSLMSHQPIGPSSAKMALLMGYNHLNTIEEEKHETQTSNYFREGGETDRDDSNVNNTNVRGSKILDDDYLNGSSSNKVSPNR